MNTYQTSDGERLTKSTIDKRVRWAKSYVLERQRMEHGYNFCEDCGISSGTYLDCSHDKSVKWCQDNGRAELAFDPKNITIRCRSCHQKHDNL